MKNKIQQALVGGIIATAAMSALMFLYPFIGMPKMNPAEMVAMMMGMPIMVGWLIHFMVGIVFALIYAFLFIKVARKINNTILKGTIFGIAVFIFAQIIMAMMSGMTKELPPSEGSMMLMMIGSILGHILFGVVVCLFVKEK